MTEKVWKTEETEYYAVFTKSKGSRACKRRVTSWTAKINGRVVEGFGTKRAALAALEEAE